MQKGFGLISILLGLLIFLLAFTGGYYLYNLKEHQLTPKPNLIPDESVLWKNYSDTKNEFSIDYPSGWHVYFLNEYPYEGYPGVINPSHVIFTPLNKFPRLSAGDSSGDQYVGFDVFSIEDDIDQLIKRLKVQQVLLNGVKVYKEAQNDGDVIWHIPFQGKKGGIVITILARSLNSVIAPQIEKSIQTFKFIKVTETDEDETANWKTYTNKTLGFALKHPSNWLIEEGKSSMQIKTGNYESQYVKFGEKLTINHIGEEVQPYPALNFSISVATSSDFRNISFEEIRDTYMTEDSVISSENRMVDFVAAKYIQHGGCASGDCVVVYLKRYDTLFIINGGNSISERLETFNRMLATFKFLE